MALDPSIILRAGQGQQKPRNMLQQYGTVLAIQGAQDDRELKRNALAQDTARRQAMSEAFDHETGTFDKSRLGAAFAQSGDLEGYNKWQTSQSTIAKNKQSERLNQLKSAREEYKFMGQVIGSVGDQQSYQGARQRFQSAGIDVSSMPEQYDPSVVEQIRRAAIDAAKRADLEMEREKFEETKRSNRVSEGQAAQRNAIAREGVGVARAGKQFDREQKMRDDHRQESKNFVDVRDAYSRVKTALKNASTSAASTLAAGTSFMKMLDPGSVVRESELGMALAATGAFDRATNYFNSLQRGNVLTKDQVKDFQNIARDIFKAAQDGQKQLDAQYAAEAKRYELDPRNVVRDYNPPPPEPSPRMIEALRQNPERAAEFDEKFGEGAARRILGGG